MDLPDFDSIPDTKDLKQPHPSEYGLHILANTIALRSIRKDLAAAKRAFYRMIAVFVAGSFGVIGSVVGVAIEFGGERAEQRHVAAEVQRHDGRIARLEQKRWSRGEED